MRRSPPCTRWLVSVLAGSFVGGFAACGGGGGGADVPAATPLRLRATDVEIQSGASGTDLVVALVAGGEAPALLRLAVVLPPALTVPTTGGLEALRPLNTLDGERQGDHFVVLAGDAVQRTAASLGGGDLFRLRLEATAPRQLGVHEVRLVELDAATADGRQVGVEPNPVVVRVTLR
jgi:hypothetical protein